MQYRICESFSFILRTEYPDPDPDPALPRCLSETEDVGAKCGPKTEVWLVHEIVPIL